MKFGNILILAISLFQSNICNEGGDAMSKDWTEEEFQAASKTMNTAGHLSYEEFCEHLNKAIFTAYCKDADKNLLKSVAHITAKKN